MEEPDDLFEDVQQRARLFTTRMQSVDMRALRSIAVDVLRRSEIYQQSGAILAIISPWHPLRRRLK